MHWMNQAKRQLDLMIARAGCVQNEHSYVLTATGAVAYSFPEPLALLAVHEMDTSGRIRRLEEMNAIEGFQYLGAAPVTGSATRYRLTQAPSELRLSLYPVPSSGSYLVTVIKQGDTLVLDNPLEGETDAVIYPMGWEEWIVLEMAKRALIKEEGDSRGIERLQKQVEQFVEENAWSRALADAPSVRDSRVTGDLTSYLVYGAPASWRFF